jgi:hypothetical protein
MNAKSIVGQLGESFALSSGSARSLAGLWRLSDFVALTKPRVMMLAIFTALLLLSIAPVRLDLLATIAAVLAIAAGGRARSSMQYGLVAAVLICVATLGGCTDGVFDPKGPVALAERQILLNALGLMLAIVVPVILATLGVAFWFRA